MSKFSRRLAVVIGINQYENGISSLRNAVNDAEKINWILQEQHGYKTWLLLDRDATQAKLIELLTETLPKEVKEDECLLFYFAGHGIALDENDGPQGYLIPQDANKINSSSYLQMKQVHDWLIALPCHHFLAILDCCFAGAFRWSSMRDWDTQPEEIYIEHYHRFIKNKAQQVITSASYDETALDIFSLRDCRGEKGNHSPFAAALIDALKGEADTSPPAKDGKPAGDGVITAYELYVYLDNCIASNIKSEKRQTPELWPLRNHDRGQYIFLTPGHELNLRHAPPLDESTNPYRGLESFYEDHKDWFFGRTALVNKLYKFVNDKALTVVLGASGAGKSSLVRAGLIPELRKNQPNWTILNPIRPGESPFRELNNALKKANLPEVEVPDTAWAQSIKNLNETIKVWASNNPDSKLLLFIDQSEELVTLCKNDIERQEFLSQLAHAITTHSHQLRVVITVRSDFEPQLREFIAKLLLNTFHWDNTAINNYWQKARFIVPTMTRAELREAIEKPAEARVMYFAPHSLVEDLINEVADMPGALPLLSFALRELYLQYLKRQKEAKDKGITIDRAITEADYKKIGGVTQSLTQRADREYEALVKVDPAFKQIIRNVMLRMVAFGGGELARRRVPMSELVYSDVQDNLLIGKSKQEYSFEKVTIFFFLFLVRERLYRLGLLLLQQSLQKKISKEVTIFAFLFIIEQRLYRLSLLLFYPSIQKKVESFIKRFSEARLLIGGNNEEESSDDEGKEPYFEPAHDALVKGWERLRNWIEAEENLELQRRLTLAAQEWQNLKNKEQYPALFKRIKPLIDWLDIKYYSVESWFYQNRFIQDTSVKFMQAWQKSVQKASLNQKNIKQTSPQFLWHDNPYLSVLKKQFITEPIWFNQLEIEFLDCSIRKKRSNIAFLVVVSWLVNTIFVGLTIWALFGLRNSLIGQIKSSHQAAEANLSLNQNFDALIASLRAGRILKKHSRLIHIFNYLPLGENQLENQVRETLHKAVYAVRERNRLKHSVKYSEQASNVIVRFSRDGQLFATAGYDGTIALWNLQGKQLRRWSGGEGEIWSIDFSPNNQLLATAGEKGIVHLWNFQGQELDKWDAKISWIQSISFSKDGRLLATAGGGGTVIWNLQDKSSIKLEERDQVLSVSFSPDGQFVAIAGAAGTVSVWNLKGQKLQESKNYQHALRSVSFSPDSQSVAVIGDRDVTNLWKWMEGPYSGQKLALWGGEWGGWSISFRPPDGQYLAFARNDGFIYFLDLLRRQNEVLKSSDSLHDVSFSPNGNLLATAGDNNNIALWNLQGVQQLVELKANQGNNQDKIKSVSFSSNGQTLITTTDNGTIRWWNLQGEPIEDKRENAPPTKDSCNLKEKRLQVRKGDQNTLDYTKAFVYDLQGKPLAKTSKGHPRGLTSISCTADGKLLATVGIDYKVRLWDLSHLPSKEQSPQSLTLVKEWKGDDDVLNFVQFSQDGKQLATGGTAHGRGRVRLWNLEGTALATWETGQGNIKSISFSADGKLLATVGEQGNPKLLPIESFDELMEQGCDWVRNYLNNSNANLIESDRHLCDNISPSTPSQQTTRVPANTTSSSTSSVVQSLAQNALSPTPPYNNGQDTASLSAPSKVQARPQNVPSSTPMSNNGQNSSEEALSDRNQATKLNSTSVETYINRGLTYHKQRNYQQAISSYSKAIALNPNSPKAYSNRAVAYIEQKDYQKAIADSSKAISLNPTYANAYINRGLAYYYQGNSQQAIANYNKAIELAPGNAIAYTNRGLAYARLGNQQAAQADKRKAANLSQRQSQ